MQEPQRNFHNSHRLRLTSRARFFFSNGRDGNSMLKCRRSSRYTPLLSHGEAIYIACPTRTTVNGWKDFRSFGSNLKDSSYLKPATVSEITDDADAPKKAKTTVPKEFINALKSEVDEMESSSPPTIQRTQQDFANYLAGSTVGHENLPKSSTSTSGAPGAPGSTADAGNVVNNANVKTIGTDPSGAFTVYQYKFSSSDALVSLV
jgi:hypothetical protein